MTSHQGRLYALALALVVFFLAWAVVAARPWTTAATPDPRLRELAAREAQLRVEAARVRTIVAARWSAYRKALRQRQAAPAATPAVQVVTLPPHVITRTS